MPPLISIAYELPRRNGLPFRPRSGHDNPMATSQSRQGIPESSPVKDLARAPEKSAVMLGPNWFASVMGTGIVAVAGATLPIHLSVLEPFALGVWFLALGLLLVLVVSFVVHWLRWRSVAWRYAKDPTLVQFYGAPPMALMTVGAGALVLGYHVLGRTGALSLDWVLWISGTILGLISAVVVPLRLFTQLEVDSDAAFGGWLMPIVPPMVSAATGGLLLTHLASEPLRSTMYYCCFALFGLSLVTSLVIISLIWSRLVYVGATRSVEVPTLWIVLGPLGQSITAALVLSAAAAGSVKANLVGGFSFLGIAYGVPIWGFAVLWICLATALTLRAFRAHLPFHLTWWSFTFPLGTFVTGTSHLYLSTSLPLFRYVAVLSYLVLVIAWLVVSLSTLRAVVTKDLLRAPLVIVRGTQAKKLAPQ